MSHKVRQQFHVDSAASQSPRSSTVFFFPFGSLRRASRGANRARLHRCRTLGWSQRRRADRRDLLADRTRRVLFFSCPFRQVRFACRGATQRRGHTCALVGFTSLTLLAGSVFLAVFYSRLCGTMLAVRVLQLLGRCRGDELRAIDGHGSWRPGHASGGRDGLQRQRRRQQPVAERDRHDLGGSHSHRWRHNHQLRKRLHKHGAAHGGVQRDGDVYCESGALLCQVCYVQPSVQCAGAARCGHCHAF